MDGKARGEAVCGGCVEACVSGRARAAARDDDNNARALSLLPTRSLGRRVRLATPPPPPSEHPPRRKRFLSRALGGVAGAGWRTTRGDDDGDEYICACVCVYIYYINIPTMAEDLRLAKGERGVQRAARPRRLDLGAQGRPRRAAARVGGVSKRLFLSACRLQNCDAPTRCVHIYIYIIYIYIYSSLGGCCGEGSQPHGGWFTSVD